MEQKGEFQAVAPVAERQSKSMGLVLAVVFLALCTLVLGGLYCYEKFIAKDNNTAIGDTSSQNCAGEEAETITEVEKQEIFGVATADHDLQARKLIKDLRKALEKGFEAEGKYGKNTISSITTYSDSDLPIVLDGGVQTFAEKSYGILVEKFPEATKAKNNDEGIRAMLKDTFTKYDMKDVTGRVFAAGYFGPDPIYYEGDEGLVCSINFDNDYLRVLCGYNDWISDEKKELVKALVKAAKDEDTELGFVNASIDDIEEGANGAQRLQGFVSDAAILFYRKNSESDWKLFMMTQNAIPCDEFNTEELKNAFNGATCYDNNVLKYSTVK